MHNVNSRLCDLDASAEELAAEARSHPNVGANRAVAGGSADINGRSIEYQSNSATDANQPPTGDWVPEPTDPVFETVRSTDAEYKILEQVAADIGDALFPDGRPAPGSVVPDAEGTVSIVVDSPPGEVCAACQDVIDQFSERYPNVEIQVRDLVGGVPGADG